MRPPREFQHILDDKASIKIGSLDKKGDRVVYLRTTFWITPQQKKDFFGDMDYLSKYYKKTMKSYIRKSELFNSTNFIIDFDNKTNYMREKKKSYVSIEVFLRQAGTRPIKEINEAMTDDYDGIVTDMLNKIEEMDYTIKAKSKKVGSK